jgi:hypothetical protein
VGVDRERKKQKKRQENLLPNMAQGMSLYQTLAGLVSWAGDRE